MRLEVAPGFFVDYIEGFYDPYAADEILYAFLAEDMTPEKVRLFGRDIVTKRRSDQYGQEYIYNPLAKPAKEWSPPMRDISRRVECVTGPLDGGLVQVYPDGEAGITWHQDDGEPEIIASLSLGAERVFAFGVVGRASTCREIWRLRLAHGSLLLIPGATNAAFKHRLPVARRVKSPRVNVTLRRFRGPAAIMTSLRAWT